MWTDLAVKLVAVSRCTPNTLGDRVESQLGDPVAEVVIRPEIGGGGIVEEELPRVARAIAIGIQTESEELFGNVLPLGFAGGAVARHLERVFGRALLTVYSYLARRQVRPAARFARQRDPDLVLSDAIIIGIRVGQREARITVEAEAINRVKGVAFGKIDATVNVPLHGV